MTTALLFGTKLSAIRKQRKISQSELAKAIGVHTGTVSHWENGKQLSDTSTRQKIVAYLGISMGELLGGYSFDSACWEFEQLVLDLQNSTV